MLKQVITIINEEFQKARERANRRGYAVASGITESAIIERLKKECIEQPEPTEVCQFCGQAEENCHGGGYDDGIEAHDFTPGGMPEEEAEDEKADGFSEALLAPKIVIPF